MKEHFFADNKASLGRRARGVALVLVLSFLVIISGLVIAFFSMVTTEASSAGIAAAAASAKSLGDAGVSFVMGSVVDATMGMDPATAGTGDAQGGPANAWAWASQPGMIRTYDNTGKQRYIYKLYSADDMKLATADGLTTTDTSNIGQWATGANRDVWTDLNEPGKDVNGYDVYPIVDPTADEDYKEASFPGHKDQRDPDHYHKVAGFRVLDNSQDNNAPPYEKRNNNPAPMPVKWLYVLQDGTMCTAKAQSTGDNYVTLNANGTAKPSKDNPIKGRIAFWTDDECSKVNINTASQGTYWDTPRVVSAEDCGTLTGSMPAKVSTPGLAITQPTKGEYQRFAGHPATTSLSPIFGYTGTRSGAKPVLPVPAYVPGANLTPDQEQAIEKYYTLTPRISTGGSLAGTAIPEKALPTTEQTQQGPWWRLYASVDELLFNPIIPSGNEIHRLPNVPYDTSGSSGGLLSVISPDMMQKSKFFITANSSAPEVTLFNTPRVSMWPVNELLKTNPATGQPTRRTPFDELAAFCATVGFSAGDVAATVANSGHPFYFTRWNPYSSTDDFLNTNNQALYAYLRKLTTLPIPGNPKGGTFAQKYANTGIKADGTQSNADVDQILTCVYDYIRCTNMQDATLDGNMTPYLYTPVDSIGAGENTTVPGAGEVMPIRIDTSRLGGTGVTQGFGRYNTVASAYLVFFAAHGMRYTGPRATVPDPNKPFNELKNIIVPRPEGQDNGGVIPVLPSTGGNVEGVADALGVVFMLSYNSPAQGQVGNHPNMTYQVENLDSLVFQAGDFTDGKGVKGYSTPVWGPPGATASGASPTSVLPHNGFNVVDNSDVRTWHGRGIGGTCGPVVGLTRGLFGYKFASNEDTGKKLCSTAGMQQNPAANNNPISKTNYPFFGYTNRIQPPPANDSGSSGYQLGKALYWPTIFKVSQKAGETIKIRLWPTGKVNLGQGTTEGDAVQTIDLVFPSGTFRMPYAKTGNGGPVYSTRVEFGNQAIVTANGDYDRSGGGTAGKFLFNAHLSSDNNAAKDPNNLFYAEDVVIALEPAGVSYMNLQTSQLAANQQPDTTAGDHRMYAALGHVPASYFQPDWMYSVGETAITANGGNVNLMDPTLIPQFAHNMMREVGTSDLTGLYYGVYGPDSAGNANAPAAARSKFNMGTLVRSVDKPSRFPDVPRRVGGTSGQNPATRPNNRPASWDTGMGLHKDGAYINKPDEGDQSYTIRNPEDPTGGPIGPRRPYIDKDDYFRPYGSFFSPNRQVPSSMMLGSISTGIQSRQPWQTLLFHPPLKNDQNNPGTDYTPPADHYMADLFWMPVVEPYAISQPFSTAGKINMNYQIQPFTYIKRDTAMRAVMTAVKMMAIPTTTGNIKSYKPFDIAIATGPGTFPQSRYPINMDATMTVLNKKFDVDHDIYRSATELSTIMLVPQDPATNLQGTETADQIVSKMNDYWSTPDAPSALLGHQLTGNNVRNKPYADMYGRLTTKSNVFTVHVRAQSLRKATGTDADKWYNGQDQVVAEYRGSSIIERYIDANDPGLPDFAYLTKQNPADPALNIDQYYKFRVVSTKRFSP